MPGNLIVALAITVIVIGFLILVGVAFWLALERRRSLSASSGPATQPRPPANQQSANQAQKAAQVVSPATFTGTEEPKEIHSGEYPSAASYDQTILPAPPKRRTRPASK